MLSQPSWTLWTRNCHQLAFNLSFPDWNMNLFRLCPELVVRIDWFQLQVIPKKTPSLSIGHRGNKGDRLWHHRLEIKTDFVKELLGNEQRGIWAPLQSWNWTRPFLAPFLQTEMGFVARDLDVTELKHQDWHLVCHGSSSQLLTFQKSMLFSTERLSFCEQGMEATPVTWKAGKMTSPKELRTRLHHFATAALGVI